MSWTKYIYSSLARIHGDKPTLASTLLVWTDCCLLSGEGRGWCFPRKRLLELTDTITILATEKRESTISTIQSTPEVFGMKAESNLPIVHMLFAYGFRKKRQVSAFTS